MKSLPSLKAIRAFEASGRLASLTAAARELNVTRPAVSKQIKILEEDIGRQLFLRSRNGLELTQTGQILFESLHHSFGLMVSACEQARQTNHMRTLKLVVERDFAASWLSSHLHRFFSIHRDISINLLAEVNETAATATDCDLKIFYAREDSLKDPNISKRQTLLKWFDLPLCSPSYDALTENNDVSAVDWSSVTLLHDRGSALWEQWLSAAGLDKPANVSENYFNETSHCLASASAGAGIAIGDTFTAHRYLVEHRLTCPVPIAIESAEAYILEITENGSSKSDVVSLFCEWLLASVQELNESAKEITDGLQIVGAH
ncbi:MAG: LysR family transcriptional regulator [Pseudomonadota bacterium]